MDKEAKKFWEEFEEFSKNLDEESEKKIEEFSKKPSYEQTKQIKELEDEIKLIEEKNKEIPNNEIKISPKKENKFSFNLFSPVSFIFEKIKDYSGYNFLLKKFYKTTSFFYWSVIICLTCFLIKKISDFVYRRREKTIKSLREDVLDLERRLKRERNGKK